MTEFKQRLTDEFSKLAEQYVQEQKELSAQVATFGRTRAAVGRAVHTQEQTKHAEWIGELGVRVTTLTDASNGVTRELNELFR